jgi:hypothetical protein
LGAGTLASRILSKLVLGTAIVALLAVGAGCGEEEGVAADATVAAYVEPPLCAGAGRQLASEDGRAGSIGVRLVCLAPARVGNRLSLATVGANARRASEDSATAAYVEPPSSPSFSRPIVEAAGIPVIRSDSGATAMSSLLAAIRDAGPGGSLRDSVRESLANP